MALRKHNPLAGMAIPSNMVPLNFPNKAVEKPNGVTATSAAADLRAEADVDIDMREVYFLIMHFLSSGPCKRTFSQLWNELLEHQLLPRRYHSWYSRSGGHSGEADDDGNSLPLCYTDLVKRYTHVEKDHLVKLLKQLIQNSSPQLHGIGGGGPPNAADVPTFLGSGSFSLLTPERYREDKGGAKLPGYLRWPHMHADQVRGLSLREIGGGFGKHHRAPSVRAACYAIAKPSTLVQKMQIIKQLRGHQNAVYCATFDRSGRFVITGSDDRLVKIWSMETAFCLASCRGHEGDITDLAVSSNNALVASSSNDFIIRVWRIPDGQPVSVLRGHTAAVTAIAFNPRPGVAFQLLSTSDDGTCRIWDARHSQPSLRVYIPKPPETTPGKSTDPSPSTVVQPTQQILCCAFNANGMVFVTGSSDTYARVWNACKINVEETDQPLHEMDLLTGHEMDVNYVQFSGCAVASRSFSGDTCKEDNIPKFKNSWFTHDNIVTCSRDGSAIIWVPRSRRSHGKVGRWTRAYHLKVPPPPMAPQPTRGGPRQRYQPTPRGVNMIVWSLDNRFVLAAIMDCRICVWNASDGSLVHSLIGHKESTFVLDVHPFNPRIAMSAGYDGKTIIWDIWEGKPVQIYETCQFKLVDGKFSPDGTSIILSDEVGQIHIIATGQGESQKDAKYDQFFLGDYRPLVRDANGNALDQETQLVPYRRNLQDLLCDSSFIPYEEPYQSMYQKRRLGTLGIEWRPPSVSFAVGPTYNTTTGEFQMLPVIDLDRWAEPLPEIPDVIDWEQVDNNEVQTDDNDSEYNVADEYSSGGEREVLSSGGSGESEYSGDGDLADNPNSSKAALRRSKRKKLKSEAELVTSSGRRVKRRNLEEHDGSGAASPPTRAHKARKSRHGRRARKKSPKSKGLRPQRRAARNALNFFSKINGASSDAEEEEEEEEELDDLEEEEEFEEEEDEEEEEEEEYENSSSENDSIPESKVQRAEESRRSAMSADRREHLLRERDESAQYVAAPSRTEEDYGKRPRLILKLPRRDPKVVILSESAKAECSKREDATISTIQNEPNHELVGWHEPVQDLVGSHEIGDTRNTIKWGEVKQRSAKRPKLNDEGEVDESKAPVSIKTEQERVESTVPINEESRGVDETGEGKKNDVPVQPTEMDSVNNNDNNYNNIKRETRNSHAEAETSSQPVRKLKIKSSGLASENPDRDDGFGSEERTGSSKKPPVVYTRSKSTKRKKDPDLDTYDVEESTSNSNNHDRDVDYNASADYNGCGARSRRPRQNYGSFEASTSGRRSHLDSQDQLIDDEWKSGCSRSTIGLRSVRTRREVNNSSSRNQPSRKVSWLMLVQHEESYRYIPQKGDEVAYLRQGHEEYLKESRRSSQETGPWKLVRDLRAVEFCRVRSLDYSTFTGSGEGCCKLTLEFVEPASSGYGKVFKITLPELVGFPDFLVERARFDASLERNWTHRDKCRVHWKNADGIGGDWWPGRILAVKPKSPDFPDSPWERYIVQYTTDGSDPQKHSPWELHDLEGECWKHPHIDERSKEKLLTCIAKLEHTSMRNQDCYGIQKLNMVAQKPDFINRFPVQFSIEVIKRRLENNYYRTLEAVKHDASVILSNAESYFGKSVEMKNKMRRLGDWIDRNFSF